MQGGPAHMDTFDYKPKLTADDGKPGTSRGGGAKLSASPFKFAQHGQSGLWISELFPTSRKHADELCLLRGMHTDIPNHPQAFVQLHTGSAQFVRPSIGAWTLYGLGTENENLPGFITISPPLQFGGAELRQRVSARGLSGHAARRAEGRRRHCEHRQHPQRRASRPRSSASSSISCRR